MWDLNVWRHDYSRWCWYCIWLFTRPCAWWLPTPQLWLVNFPDMFIQQVDDELEIKAYYAGHVLGAAMFQIKVGSDSVVYTVSSLLFSRRSGRCRANLRRIADPTMKLSKLYYTFHIVACTSCIQLMYRSAFTSVSGVGWSKNSRC